MRLEQLWGQVKKRWERDGALELVPTDRPIWDETTIAIAEANAVDSGRWPARVRKPRRRSCAYRTCARVWQGGLVVVGSVSCTESTILEPIHDGISDSNERQHFDGRAQLFGSAWHAVNNA
jgi:hypothetical protein